MSTQEYLFYIRKFNGLSLHRGSPRLNSQSVYVSEDLFDTRLSKGEKGFRGIYCWEVLWTKYIKLYIMTEIIIQKMYINGSH